MALRTLWIRIDFPLKRSSAAALSERMATRSSTAFRAIDCGTSFAAFVSPVRLRETFGTSSFVLSVEQQDRDPVHVHDLERDVHHLVQQLVQLLLPRQLLGDLEQQLELLLAALRLGLGLHLEVGGAAAAAARSRGRSP